MKPIHLLIALGVIVAFAFVAYRGGEAPVQASADKAPETPRIVQQPPKIE